MVQICLVLMRQWSDIYLYLLLYLIGPWKTWLWSQIKDFEIHIKDRYIEGILPKGPYPPCVSMAGRALLAGCHRYWTFPVKLPLAECLKISLNIIQHWYFMWWHSAVRQNAITWTNADREINIHFKYLWQSWRILIKHIHINQFGILVTLKNGKNMITILCWYLDSEDAVSNFCITQ